ncbi:hypothetical protein PHPALM_37449 [Phytophthora palmivora]|uniref:Uncharacterized protein n=1 Tax=Phytophthora palmivora TaxID=4796 RepID=A0A2P4WXE5_9STRA|nr:hypothetical protein PHPALM_37449 [Phytophthora palmivora]
MARGTSDEYGFKRSSGVDYSQVRDRQVDDDRFERQRAIRAATAAPPPIEQSKHVGAQATAPQSATMDAFMRMMTGKEERTIADRISDPNRPTWEQYKKENADKLDLNGNGEKEMKEYRKKLDAAREKKLAGVGNSKKRKKRHKKRSRSSSSDDSSSEDERRRSKHKNRKKKSSHKRRRRSSDTDNSDSEDDRSRRYKRSKKSKKASRRKDRETSPSPVRLSSFLQHSSDSDDQLPTRAMADTESRRKFMQLLRQGVQHKVQQQQTQSVKSRASDSSDTSEVRRASLPECSMPSKELANVGAWQTLAWRDAFSMAPYFLETVNGRPLRIKQVLQGELNGFGTGLTVWPAACVLLKHLEHRAASNSRALVDSDNPFVLELGSGTGAVGIAVAMLLEAGRVVLTDMDNVRFIMQENADLAQENSVINSDVVVDVEGYEWGQAPSEKLIPSSGNSYPDLILVSDCILPRLYPIEPLVEALARLSGRHTRILISYEHRHYQHFQPKDRFWKLMKAKGFSLRVIDSNEYHPHYVAEDIEVWEITVSVG